MYYRTTKLKRYKVLKAMINIIIFPIRFPLFIMCILTESVFRLLENTLNGFDSFLWWIMNSLVKIFKFDDIADEQYEKNKEKFKTDYQFAILRKDDRN